MTRSVPYDPITLSIFSNRFMSIAEAMGRSLQQTSISTNIKERLDYSCAVFAPTGDLVANAPFMPVHLGSMSSAVKFQLNLHKGNLKPGDVLLTNSPSFGGSHLPDITAITPCFDPEDPTRLIFFTASRGHHADIGGILPGSMPPTSTELYEEGAQIGSLKVVDQGVYQGEALYKLLVEDPAKFPGCSGCRNWRDIESDLKAQIAANHKGMQLITALVHEYGLQTVHEYMSHIRDNAESAVRAMLKDASQRIGTSFSAVDYLDDGSPICLHVEIDPATGGAVFDFEGTGPELRGNLNAPSCVVHAAVIYCLRSMIGEDIPLNAGCLVPLDIRIPVGSLLSPSETAAVCGGNVMTSQRVTDVVLKAFKAAAASQGCCNNLTFGLGGKDEKTGEVSDGWGYYETISGGSGAGPTWDGTSGVHTHMTNTRITDPEILERRYPVLLKEFHFREGSAGQGAHKGGEGNVRSYQFLQSLRVSIMSERRTRPPYGQAGGEDGGMGKNVWLRGDGTGTGSFRAVNFGGKASMMFGVGDVLEVHTPGGGGWGAKGTKLNGAADEGMPRFEARGRIIDQARVEF